MAGLLLTVYTAIDVAQTCYRPRTSISGPDKVKYEKIACRLDRILLDAYHLFASLHYKSTSSLTRSLKGSRSRFLRPLPHSCQTGGSSETCRDNRPGAHIYTSVHQAVAHRRCRSVTSL